MRFVNLVCIWEDYLAVYDLQNYQLRVSDVKSPSYNYHTDAIVMNDYKEEMTSFGYIRENLRAVGAESGDLMRLAQSYYSSEYVHLIWSPHSRTKAKPEEDHWKVELDHIIQKSEAVIQIPTTIF